MSTTGATSFGDLLRRFRLAAGLTQEELAERAGLSRRGITDLERGARTTPRRETVGLLANALGLGGSDRDTFVATARRRSCAPAASPLQTLDTQRHNLPIQPTALLGREQEVAAACALLHRDDVRLVTLTGPGGIGKTCLAVEVAAELLDDFPDGVWFVSLSGLTDPALVVPTVAQTLGLREQGSQPFAEILRQHLRHRRLLLVLDNFEQVAAAAPEVAALLAAAPRLSVLVTSRVTLHLRGERDYPLAPLPLPDPDHLPPPERLAQYAAVALFVERAQAARPDFQLTGANAPAIAEICARLDGLPLALELAATRVKLLPPDALLGRLSSRLQVLTDGPRDLEERQRTLRATLAWSVDLLTPQERILFRRLAVFVGGCTLEAAETVCAAPAGAEPLTVGLLDGLGALVDQSLVQQHEEGGQPRVGMLHVVREFALEQLDQSGDAVAIQHAHAAYYTALGEEAEPHLWGAGQQLEWMRRLEGEHDNLRAALGWLRGHGEVPSAVRLAVAIGRFWFFRGHYEEGARWLESLLASPGATDPAIDPTLHGRALFRAGILVWMRGDAPRLGQLAEEALARARAAGDVEGSALAWQLYAFATALEGQLDQAAEYANHAVAAARQAGVRRTLALELYSLGHVLLMQGELERAQAAAAEGLGLGRAQGDEVGAVLCLEVLSAVACRQGDAAGGRRHAVEALALSQEVEFFSGLAVSLLLLAGVAALGGRVACAGRLFGFAGSMVGHSETFSGPVRQALKDVLAPAREALGEEAWEAALAAGQALSLEEVIAEALGETGRDA
ncbi:MAG TPA: helix-turn-helix domain-containing protein [Ktedonobacterales bacterium]|nr:helix-turn-helix domain-containing protein [Ktedonobacterales bacterium]